MDVATVWRRVSAVMRRSRGGARIGHSGARTTSGSLDAGGGEPRTKNGALRLLARYCGDARPLQEKAPAEIGKILNYVAFSHCSVETPHTGVEDLDELFDVCRTSCGGYAYVLMELMRVFGIRTRYANLYNLPKQGNHTMVEAELEPGRWSMFDPTFGVFFSTHLDGMPMALEELRFTLLPETIQNFVFTARDKNIPPLAGIEDLYAASTFAYPNMDLDAYLIAEAAAPVGHNLVLPLVMPLVLLDGKVQAGEMGIQTVTAGQQAFLKWTDQTLITATLEDDTSYLFQFVGDNSPYYKSASILRLSGLDCGATYRLSISGVAPEDAHLQIVDIGRDIRLNSVLPEEVRAGPFAVERRFRALNERGDIYLNVSGATIRYVYLFGVQVELECEQASMPP